MASRFLSIAKGGHTITIGAGTASAAIEVQVDLTKVDNTQQVIMGLEKILDRIKATNDGTGLPA